MPARRGKDGIWRWRKVVTLPNGKRLRGSGTPLVNTKQAAEKAERDWVANAEKGKPTVKVAESPTLRSVQVDYLKHLEMHRSPSLHANRTSTLKQHIMPWFGHKRLDAITTAEIDEFKAHQLSLKGAERLEPGTINNHVMSLTNMLRWAKKRGLLHDLPDVELLERKDKSDVEHLEDAELDDVLAKTEGELRTMILVAAHTGMRAGELIALLWTDIDFKRNRIRVQRGVYRGKDRPTKSKRARTVPLSRTARAALLAHPRRGPLVFCHDDTSAMPYATALYRLQAATELTGWHVLRHTFGTRLSSRGVPLKAIQEWMGHSSIKTTMIYAHYSPVLDGAIHVLDGDSWQTGAKLNPDNLKDE
jgi:integrase